MPINSIIELCLQRATEAGLSAEKQDDVAARVLREIRPEWSDSQIDDTISRVRSSAFGAAPAPGRTLNGSLAAA